MKCSGRAGINPSCVALGSSALLPPKRIPSLLLQHLALALVLLAAPTRSWPRAHTGSSPQPECAHLAVAVASQLGDEADVVIPDLNHLLADVVLGADAALCARPPGQKITGWEWALALGPSRAGSSTH